MNRTRFSGLLSAAVLLLSLGLIAPAMAEPTPPGQTESVSASPDPASSTPEVTDGTPAPDESTGQQPSPLPDETTPSVESGPPEPPVVEEAVEQQPAVAPAPQQRALPAPEVAAEADTGGFAPIDDFAAANPWIGDPTADAKEAFGGGRLRTFANATVFWSAQTGAQAVSGAILAKFNSLPRNLELFGYPTSGENPLGTARQQQFTKSTFYWSSATGARTVQGAIRGVYLKNNGNNGPLGLPTSDEFAVAGGIQQNYQGGAILYSRTTGTHVVWGAIGTIWRNEGGAGYFGLPTSGEVKLGTRQVIQHFQRGSIVWNDNRTYSVAGAIGTVWHRAGGPNSPLGLPAGKEIRLGTRKVAQYFQRGMIIWNNNRTYAVSGGIGDYWKRNGGLNSRFGAPTSGEIQLGNRRVMQNFEGGPITWDNGRIVTFTVRGAIGTYWNRNGGYNGRFGAPTSNEICNNAGCYQNFQRGSITWGPTTGAHDLYKLDSRCTYGRAVCADKTTNKLYWVVDGRILGTWDARFGAPGWETTNGEMPIIRKIENDWSVPFSAWMPFSQYFTNNGMAIHYSSSFEQQGFPSWGSHGCINMNDYNAARWLYNQTRLGDRVVVYYS